jgi:CRISPR/Cas system-associated exonuclease Cas4 (RecB family)
MLLSASEVAEFGGYCPQSWWLRRHGAVGAAIGELRREDGVLHHRDRGRQTDRMNRAEAASRSARRLALGLVAVAALLVLFALVTRAPLVWAAGEDRTDLPGRVSAITGVFPSGEPSLADAVAALLAASLTAFVVAAWLNRQGRRMRVRLGLAGPLERAAVLAADDSQLGPLTLRSEQLGLVARPDHLIRLPDGTVIPVEQKPRARRLYRSHILELGTQLLLVEASFGLRPPYGVVVLADGVQHRVPFDHALERAVLDAAREMRACVAAQTAPGRRWLGAKCRSCEFYTLCWTGSSGRTMTRGT